MLVGIDGVELTDKIVLTKEMKKTLLMLKTAWSRGRDTFSNTVSFLSTKQAEQIYQIVRHSVYKESYVQILREHPELREIIKNDDDRLCMHDIYEILSWRLDKNEPPPKELRIADRVKGSLRAGTS